MSQQSSERVIPIDMTEKVPVATRAPSRLQQTAIALALTHTIVSQKSFVPHPPVQGPEAGTRWVPDKTFLGNYSMAEKRGYRHPSAGQSTHTAGAPTYVGAPFARGSSLFNNDGG